MNDVMFKYIKLCDLTKMGNKILKNLHINVIPSAEIVTNKNEKMRLMKQYHEHPLFGGHMGRRKLYEKLRGKFYWKGMSKDVTKFINACKTCHLSKPKHKIKVPMTITDTPQKPFDIVIIDTIGPLPISNNGNSYAVTIVDELTKYLVSIPIANKAANTTAKAIFENFILTFGLMKEIRSDCGTEYKNEIISDLNKLLNVKHSFSLPYRHETVGTAERNHRFFNQYFRSYTQEVNDWEEYLKYFTYCYNITTNASLDDKYSPFELIFCKKSTLPHSLRDGVEPIYNVDNFANEAKFRMQTAHKIASSILVKTKHRNKKIYDKDAQNIDLNINDIVYIAEEPYDKKKYVNKGPYVVKELILPNVKLFDQENDKYITVHMNRVRI